MMIQNMSR